MQDDAHSAAALATADRKGGHQRNRQSTGWGNWLPGGGLVRLAADCQNGRLSILVENTFDAEATPGHRNGMGLENVRQRLEARYQKLANMRVTPNATNFQVNLSLPAESPEVQS